MIYVASSWRNPFQPNVVKTLREAGFDVFDFRNPPSDGHGFRWSELSENYMDWSFAEYKKQMGHPLAVKQFENDFEAMRACDACVLVLPCGKSAHMEAGWFSGCGKKVLVYMPEKQEPELMYRLFTGVYETIDEVIAELKRV